MRMPTAGLAQSIATERLDNRYTRLQTTFAPHPHGMPDQYPRPTVPSLVETAHLALLLSVFPCTVLWFPVFKSGTFGTLTLLDCVLLMLWCSSSVTLLSFRRQTLVVRRAVRVWVFALLAGSCSMLGSVAYGNTSNISVDLLHILKEFGFASILPLGVLLAPQRQARRLITVSLLASTSFNVLVQVAGLQHLLPIFAQFSDLTLVQKFRPTGAVSNPNDYAYISVLGFAFALASWLSLKRSTPLSRILLLMCLLICLYGVVTSGSRSAVLGAAVGGIYYLARGKDTLERRLGFTAVVALGLFLGWTQSTVFQQRMDSALTNRLDERNLEARIEAQVIALRTWFSSPLGVGTSNMPEATRPYAIDAEMVVAVSGSDNIYVDFLLGSGVEGLVFLLLCLFTCWKLASTQRGSARATVFQSAIIFVSSAGFATVAPASLFVAPFFFALVGFAALPERTLQPVCQH